MRQGPGGQVRWGVARAGEAYSAHDPDLQRWVHATLLDSIPLTYELLVGPLTLPERDRYCSEAAIMEPLLGMPAGWLPRDSAQLDTYMREMLAGGRIVVTDTSRAARPGGALPAAVVRRLAGVPGDAVAHDRIAAAIDPPGVRVRVAGARRASVRALDDAAPHVAAAAAAARTRVAGGTRPGRGRPPHSPPCRDRPEAVATRRDSIPLQ